MDPDQDQLRIVSHTAGSFGTVACTVAACSYALDAGYNGSFPVVDTFTYIVTDGKTGSDEDCPDHDRDEPPAGRTPDEVHTHGRVMQHGQPDRQRRRPGRRPADARQRLE